MARGREHACRHQQRIAGKKESDEKAGLDEDDDADEQRPAPLDQALHIEKEMKKMLDRSDHFFPRAFVRPPPVCERLLPKPAEPSDEGSRRLHPYTVTENDRIL